MKAFAKVFGWASIVGAVLLFPGLSDAQFLGKMRVRLVVGDVQVKIAETGEWAPVSVNMPLVVGDELWVPEGSLSAIQTTNGAYVRLDGNTALQVLRVSRNSYQFSLPQGRAYVLNNALRSSVLQFDTPDASIRTFGASIASEVGGRNGAGSTGPVDQKHTEVDAVGRPIAVEIGWPGLH